jgi:hypothetical protein
MNLVKLIEQYNSGLSVTWIASYHDTTPKYVRNTISRLRKEGILLVYRCKNVQEQTPYHITESESISLQQASRATLAALRAGSFTTVGAGESA